MSYFVNHLIGQVHEHNDFEKAKKILKAMATIILASLASDVEPAKRASKKKRSKKNPTKKAAPRQKKHAAKKKAKRR